MYLEAKGERAWYQLLKDQGLRLHPAFSSFLRGSIICRLCDQTVSTFVPAASLKSTKPASLRKSQWVTRQECPKGGWGHARTKHGYISGTLPGQLNGLGVAASSPIISPKASGLLAGSSLQLESSSCVPEGVAGRYVFRLLKGFLSSFRKDGASSGKVRITCKLKSLRRVLGLRTVIRFFSHSTPPHRTVMASEGIRKAPQRAKATKTRRCESGIYSRS